MIVGKVKKLDWLDIAVKLLGAIGILAICPAGTLFVFFDSPSPNWDANNLFIYSLISFPIVCIGSSIGIWFLKNKHKKLAFYVFLLPVIPIILINVGSNWTSESYPTMRKQGNATPVGTCAVPLLDGGDGLKTTGCGLLENDVPVTGIISNTSESHNWQFSYQFTPPYKTGGITIIIENDGKACPQISILDTSGRVIEGHTVGYDLDKCPKKSSGFEFNPSIEGTYILRISAPKKPGAYWLRIQTH